MTAIDRISRKPKIVDIDGIEFKISKPKISDMIEFTRLLNMAKESNNSEDNTKAMIFFVFKSLINGGVREKGTEEFEKFEEETLEEMEPGIFDKLVKEILEFNEIKMENDVPKLEQLQKEG